MGHLRPQCSHCIYWVTDPSVHKATVGHCHRYPPGLHVNPQTGTVIQRFPATDHHHWCGEWNCDESWIDEALHQMTVKTAAKSTA